MAPTPTYNGAKIVDGLRAGHKASAFSFFLSQHRTSLGSELSSDVGQWAAKDPIFFAGGDTDLYAYCFNDPINFVDPWGLCNRSSALRNLFKRAEFGFMAAQDLQLAGLLPE